MNNYHQNNKRFLSAKEIHSYKEGKNEILKLIRIKNNINKFSRNKLNNLNSISNINNTLISIKDNNNHFDYKISSSTKSFCTNFSFKNNNNLNIESNKIRNIKLIKRFKPKETKYNKNDSSYFKNSIEKQHTNINSNMNNISSNEINDKEFGSTFNYNNITNDFDYNSLTNIDNFDNIFDRKVSEDIKDVYQKMNLEKLKIKVDKFEKSKQYLPDDGIIHKHSFDGLFFKRKIFINRFEKENFYKNKKELFSIKNNNIKKRRIISAPKIKQKKINL